MFLRKAHHIIRISYRKSSRQGNRRGEPKVKPGTRFTLRVTEKTGVVPMCPGSGREHLFMFCGVSERIKFGDPEFTGRPGRELCQHSDHLSRVGWTLRNPVETARVQSVRSDRA